MVGLSLLLSLPVLVLSPLILVSVSVLSLLVLLGTCKSNQGLVVYVCRFSWFLKQYCKITATVLASVYVCAT